jgi:hypothetical protein
MSGKSKDKSKTIAGNIAKWNKERILSEYMREKLAETDLETNKTNLDTISDRIIEKAKIEDEPKWTSILLSMMKTEDGKKQEPGVINFFQIASNEINDGLGRLINVTPKKIKNGIESII